MALMFMNSEFVAMNLFYGGGTGLEATTLLAQMECFVARFNAEIIWSSKN